MAGWLHRYEPREHLRTRPTYHSNGMEGQMCNPALCNPTVSDAVKVRMGSEVMEECEASPDVLLSDTMDQYRTFQMCERLLHSPTKLGNQLLFQIPPHRQAMLIERCGRSVSPYACHDPEENGSHRYL